MIGDPSAPCITSLAWEYGVVTAVKRPQSGRLDACLFYMLIALVAVIGVATALA